MKKYNVLLSILTIGVLSLSSCAKTPNEVQLIPQENINVSIHTDLQKGFIEANNPDDYISQHDAELTSYSYSAPKPIIFSFDVTTDNGAVASSYDLFVSENSDLSSALHYTSGSSDIDVYNLKLNTKYYYQVTANYKKGSFTSDIYSLTTEDSIVRNIYVEGVENIRDLGGYRLENGKRIKQGLIYRTAQFNYDKNDSSAIKSEPTQKGLNTLLNELKIKTDVDVREKSNKSGQDETNGITSSPLGEGVNYQYLPLRFGGSNIFAVEQNKESLKSFFELCADERNYPIAFHCVRGTDRTGALAWALEALCGVDEADLYRDYLFSNFAKIGGTTIRKKNINGTSYYPYGISSSEGDSMSEKTINYLISSVGVSRETLIAIQDILIEK